MIDPNVSPNHHEAEDGAAKVPDVPAEPRQDSAKDVASLVSGQNRGDLPEDLPVFDASDAESTDDSAGETAPDLAAIEEDVEGIEIDLDSASASSLGSDEPTADEPAREFDVAPLTPIDTSSLPDLSEEISLQLSPPSTAAPNIDDSTPYQPEPTTPLTVPVGGAGDSATNPPSRTAPSSPTSAAGVLAVATAGRESSEYASDWQRQSPGPPPQLADNQLEHPTLTLRVEATVTHLEKVTDAAVQKAATLLRDMLDRRFSDERLMDYMRQQSIKACLRR